MASEAKAQAADRQARREQIVSEWANVGLCAGMYRPPNHAAQAAISRPDPNRDLDDWQPHKRCCA